MTFTELHNKPIKKDAEDLLTSDIFGGLSFLPHHYLREVLSEAVHVKSRETLSLIPEILENKYFFWPKVRSNSTTEPDLFLYLEHPNDEVSLILIEAKHLSGKSSEADLTKNEIKDQLAREYEILVKEELYSQVVDVPNNKKIINKLLLYVTGSDSLPRKDTDESLKSIKTKISKKQNDFVKLYWLPWWKIFSKLEQLQDKITDIGQKRVIEHILNILQLKNYSRINEQVRAPIFSFEPFYSSKFKDEVPEAISEEYNIALKFSTITQFYTMKSLKNYDFRLNFKSNIEYK